MTTFDNAKRALLAAEDLIANRWGYPDDASSRASVLAEIRAAINEHTDLHLTLTKTQQGELVLVSWQDDEHRIVKIVWQKPT